LFRFKFGRASDIRAHSRTAQREIEMANKRAWTAQDIRELKKHSKSKTPVAVISKTTKRTPGALRQKALLLGLPLGHRR
jgi:hypothetical protein